MKNLYEIDFNDNKGVFSWGVTRSSIYVIAESYEQAAVKAMLYLESKPKQIIDEDGSLQQEAKLAIKAIRLISDEVIW